MNGAMLLVPISSDEAARLELQLFDKGPHMHQGRAERFIRLVFVFHPLKGAVASKRRRELLSLLVSFLCILLIYFVYMVDMRVFKFLCATFCPYTEASVHIVG